MKSIYKVAKLFQKSAKDKDFGGSYFTPDKKPFDYEEPEETEDLGSIKSDTGFEDPEEYPVRDWRADDSLEDTEIEPDEDELRDELNDLKDRKAYLSGKPEKRLELIKVIHKIHEISKKLDLIEVDKGHLQKSLEPEEKLNLEDFADDEDDETQLSPEDDEDYINIDDIKKSQDFEDEDKNEDFDMDNEKLEDNEDVIKSSAKRNAIIRQARKYFK